jgi:hypothetical protein
MGSWTTIGLAVLVLISLGVGFLIGALVLHWVGRRQLLGSFQYILDRVQLVESDLARLSDNGHVLSELLKARGLVDEEDLIELRRELIERPRQIEAERAELLQRAEGADISERVIKDIPDTLH